jgi:hypothetical protein
MPFDSLEQAYHLYNYKRKVFNQIAGAYGVPQLWHDYKRLRDTGSNAKDAAKQVHRYTIKKWQNILKNTDSQIIQMIRHRLKNKSLVEAINENSKFFERKEVRRVLFSNFLTGDKVELIPLVKEMFRLIDKEKSLKEGQTRKINNQKYKDEFNKLGQSLFEEYKAGTLINHFDEPIKDIESLKQYIRWKLSSSWRFDKRTDMWVKR